MIDRRAFLVGAVGAFAAPRPAVAQQTGRVNRIGFLRVGSPPATWIEGFRQGLRELPYVEGQNIVIEYGLAEDAAQLPHRAWSATSRQPGSSASRFPRRWRGRIW